tara:strand:- start:1570 stop:2220 length:651 start_codon:yes stop_codon:yes gene_type:complete
MSFTYDELKQAIQDYTENTETTFVNNLPLFIRASEERILKTVQLSFFRRNQTATLTQNNKYLNCPSDFLAPYSLSFTDGSSDKNFLEFKDVNFIQTFTPDASTAGAPRYYSQFDVSNFIVGPTPDSDYAVELHYFYRPASLTAGAGNGTTWISLNAELLLLYGALVEAYIFMKGEQDVMALYDKRFQEGLLGMKLLGEAKETTQDYRVGQVIRAKQ